VKKKSANNLCYSLSILILTLLFWGWIYLRGVGVSTPSLGQLRSSSYKWVIETDRRKTVSQREEAGEKQEGRPVKL
jgi:hypothetical protein